MNAVHGLNGYPLTLLVFTLAAGAFCLKLGKGARVLSLCAAFAALFAVLAIPPWLDALASVFATGPGMAVLVLLAIVSGAVYLTDHLRHHHPVRTSVFGIVAATTGVMAWAMAPELGQQGAKLGPQTAAALGQATKQIQSGHAASAVNPSTALVILAAGVVVLFAVGRVLHRHHKRRPFSGAKPFGGTKAITAGPRPGNAPRSSRPGGLPRPFGGK
jgi:MFS family permease